MPDTYKNFTEQELKERFDYNPDTGELIHKKGKRKGKVAGSVLESNGGYRYITIGKDGKPHSMLAHRVIWLMYYGEMPPEGLVIDHIDGNPDNNRIENLRAVTHKENSKNRGRRKRKVNSRYVLTAVPGIKFDKKEMCYVVKRGDLPEIRTLDFDDAKYARWDWEFDNNWTDRF